MVACEITELSGCIFDAEQSMILSASWVPMLNSEQQSHLKDSMWKDIHITLQQPTGRFWASFTLILLFHFVLRELQILWSLTETLQLLIEVPTAWHLRGRALAMWISHVRTYWTTCLLFLVLSPSIAQTEPQAGPWLISGIHEPNQSVINFLYGTNLDDKMSGNTQG